MPSRSGACSGGVRRAHGRRWPAARSGARSDKLEDWGLRPACPLDEWDERFTGSEMCPIQLAASSIRSLSSAAESKESTIASGEGETRPANWAIRSELREVGSGARVSVSAMNWCQLAARAYSSTPSAAGSVRTSAEPAANDTERVGGVICGERMAFVSAAGSCYCPLCLSGSSIAWSPSERCRVCPAVAHPVTVTVSGRC